MGEAVYFAIFWVGAACGLLFFLVGGEALAEAAVGCALTSLVMALWLEWRRRRGRR